MLPILGVTVGDVAGIGPEIIVKALTYPHLQEICRLVVIGDSETIERTLEFVPAELTINRIEDLAEVHFTSGTVNVLQATDLPLRRVKLGNIDENAGLAASQFVREAVRLALSGRIAGIVTAPLNKEAMNRAGIHYPGHTEILAELTGAMDFRLMLVADSFRIVHNSIHIPLKEAIKLVTEERVLRTIALTHMTMLSLGITKPKIAVAGLNPHASENGLFGDEEARFIAPAVSRAKTEGWNVSGPLPPDTVFFKTYRGEFDAVVAMYHDQGHNPFKMVAFEKGVNVTLGLPIIRTSVDHGTAFDIAGKGIADPSSLIEAIKLAAVLAGKFIITHKSASPCGGTE